MDKGSLGDTIDYRRAERTNIEVEETARVDGMTAGLVRLSRLGGIMMLGSGNIAVAQPQKHQLLFLTSTAQPVVTFGRAGSGPGEFQSMFSTGAVGDTAWVADSRLRRVTFIKPNGELLRVISLPGTVRGSVTTQQKMQGTVPIAPIGMQGDAFIGLWFGGNEELFRSTLDGELINNLPIIEREADAHWIRTPNGGATEGNLFGFGPKLDLSDQSDLIGIVRPSVSGDGASSTISLIAVTGDTVFHIVLTLDPDRISPSDVDSAVAHRTRGAGPDVVAAFHRDAYIPPFHLPIVDIMVAQDGAVWLQLYSDGEQKYIVVNARGQLRGEATFPSNTRVVAANDSVAWAIETNDLDVPSIVKYRLVLSPGPQGARSGRVP